MDQSLEEKRVSLYRQLPEESKERYVSTTPGKIVALKLDAGEEQGGAQISMCLDVIGDVILGLHKKTELASLLVNKANVSEENAQDIVVGLSDFFDKTPEVKLATTPANKDVPIPITKDELMANFSAKKPDNS